ncbi:MAG: SHD1 domain-containing protein, partial [Pirellulales bacterium]
RFNDVTTRKQITAIPHGYEYLGGFEISPDGKRLLTCDFQRGTPAEAARVDRPVKPSRLDLWDIAKKTRVAALAGHASQITGGRFSPSGKTVIACDQGEGSPPSTATPAQLLRDRSAYILEWDLRTFRVVAGARGKVNMPDGGLGGDSDGSVAGKNKIHFSQDGSTLAYVKLNSVKLWSTNRGPKRPSSDTLAPPVDKPDADKPEEGDAPMGDGVELREWRLRDAKNAFEARFVAFSNGKVTLEKKDGAKLTLPIGRLSMEDQEYVRQRAPVEK